MFDETVYLGDDSIAAVDVGTQATDVIVTAAAADGIISTAPSPPRPHVKAVKKKRRKKSRTDTTGEHNSSSKPRKTKSSRSGNSDGSPSRKSKNKPEATCSSSELPDQKKKKNKTNSSTYKEEDKAEEASMTSSTWGSSTANNSSLHEFPLLATTEKNEQNTKGKDRKKVSSPRKKKSSKSSSDKKKASSTKAITREETLHTLTVNYISAYELLAHQPKEESSAPKTVKRRQSPNITKRRSTSIERVKSETSFPSTMNESSDFYSETGNVSQQNVSSSQSLGLPSSHGETSKADSSIAPSSRVDDEEIPPADESTPLSSTRKQRYMSPIRFRRFLEVFNDNATHTSKAQRNSILENTSSSIADSPGKKKMSLRSSRWASPRRIRHFLQPIKLNRRTTTENVDASAAVHKNNCSTTKQRLQKGKPEMVRMGSFSDMSESTMQISNQSRTVVHTRGPKIKNTSGVVGAFSDHKGALTEQSVVHNGLHSTLEKDEGLPITPKPSTVPSESDREEFSEKLSFAFDLCRRRMTQQSSSEDEGSFAFLPLMDMFMDEVNVTTFRKVARRNRDLELVKLHLYQLHFADPHCFESFLDILQKYFGSSVRQIALNFTTMKKQDIAAITYRFSHLEELCLFGQLSDCSDEYGTNVFGPLMSQVRVLVLPHMDSLPDGIYDGLSDPQCVVQNLTVKVDSEVERLVQALKTGQSVRRLRLETSTKSSWLPKMLAEYDKLESLEIYVNERDFSDRLSAWMI
jgi:hypothetical protein